MTEREKILGRIREALTAEAPLPGHHGTGQPHHAHTVAPSAQAREWLPSVGETIEEQIARFAANSAELRTDFRLLSATDSLEIELAKLRDAEGWKKIATHSGELTERALKALNLPVCRTDKGYDVQEMESCDVGISQCDGLVAQTGSVLVTSRSCGGRALSVLPPHHVVLARRDQIVRDLPAAFQFLKQNYADNYPSMISFITGPSRTGDIERILVLGAHGPKKLTIFVV
ncbi:MAG TPA: lactate utilization protein [Candidatus Paceibacterota bacterium]|nr:lactate utilization protein [Candidatus Paceibacterota bacterium]